MKKSWKPAEMHNTQILHKLCRFTAWKFWENLTTHIRLIRLIGLLMSKLAQNWQQMYFITQLMRTCRFTFVAIVPQLSNFRVRVTIKVVSRFRAVYFSAVRSLNTVNAN